MASNGHRWSVSTVAVQNSIGFQSNSRRHSVLVSADTDEFTYVVPRTRTELCEREFASAGPTAWNKLSESYRTDNDTTSFMRNLKLIFLSPLLINSRFIFYLVIAVFMCKPRLDRNFICKSR